MSGILKSFVFGDLYRNDYKIKIQFIGIIKLKTVRPP